MVVVVVVVVVVVEDVGVVVVVVVVVEGVGVVVVVRVHPREPVGRGRLVSKPGEVIVGLREGQTGGQTAG